MILYVLVEQEMSQFIFGTGISAAATAPGMLSFQRPFVRIFFYYSHHIPSLNINGRLDLVNYCLTNVLISRHFIISLASLTGRNAAGIKHPFSSHGSRWARNQAKPCWQAPSFVLAPGQNETTGQRTQKGEVDLASESFCPLGYICSATSRQSMCPWRAHCGLSLIRGSRRMTNKIRNICGSLLVNAKAARIKTSTSK